MPRSPCSGRGLLGVGRVPLGAADGGEQHRIGRMSLLERLVGKRCAGRVDRSAAEQRLGELEADVEAFTDGAEDLDRLGGDLGTDAVAGQQADSVGGWHGSSIMSVLRTSVTQCRSTASYTCDRVERPAPKGTGLCDHANARRLLLVSSTRRSRPLRWIQWSRILQCCPPDRQRPSSPTPGRTIRCTSSMASR